MYQRTVERGQANCDIASNISVGPVDCIIKYHLLLLSPSANFIKMRTYELFKITGDVPSGKSFNFIFFLENSLVQFLTLLAPLAMFLT